MTPLTTARHQLLHASALLGLAVVVLGCKAKESTPEAKDPSSATPTVTTKTPNTPNTPKATNDAPTAVAKPAANPVATTVLPGNKISVRVGDLPAPFATDSARKGPDVVAIPKNPVLNVPAGFSVNVFADNLESPRWLAITPDGQVLVTETRANRIRLLADTNGDGQADKRSEFATAKNLLNIPFGMAFAGSSFFVGNTAEVRRYPFAAGQTSIDGEGEVITKLTPGGYRQHWTRNVMASPKGDKLFFSIGSRTNVDEEALPRAAVSVMNLDGSERKVFASGLRNPVGLDFHPVSGELHVTVNERDGLGDDLVPDYFTRVRDGEFFGWPYAYLAPGNLDPRQLKRRKSTRPDLAAKTRTPDVLFQAHSAALGVRFYTGTTFPERYRQGAFVAFRGSWNRDQGTGYKIVFVPFDEKHRPLGHYEDFLTGFLTDPSGPTTWGRPVGLLVLADGSLILTEEANNRIYRIQYDR